MNITRENSGELTVIINVNITEADYAVQFEKALKELQKKANIKGFRPGKVPVTFLKKMHGREILAEELDKLINESINNYIKDNKINIVYNPIPVDDDKEEIDLLLQKEFNFKFELGFFNDFDINIEELEVTKFDIEPDKEMIDEQIAFLLKRYGSEIEVDVVDEESSAKVMIEELDNAGNPKEGGIKNSSYIGLENLKKINLENFYNKLLGAKKEDRIYFDIEDLGHNHSFIENTLKIDHEQVHQAIDNKIKLSLVIDKIKKTELAKLDSELYKKVFPTDEIVDEQQFRDKMFEILKKELSYLSENNFGENILKTLQDKYVIDLPIDFIKKYIMQKMEKNDKKEIDFDKEMDLYLNYLRLDIVKKKLAEMFEMKIEMQDLKEYSLKLTKEKILNYGLSLDQVPEDMLIKMSEEFIKDEKQFNKMADDTFEDKVLELLKSKVKINVKLIPYNEFKNLKN